MANASHISLTPQFINIPNQLKLRNTWLVWKGDKRPYKATRRPVYASPTDPSTWSSYEASKARYEDGGMLGIGTVLNGDGVTAIDLDDCVKDGTPNNESISLIQALEVEYVELSPSGTGLHGWFLSDLQRAKKGFIGNLSTEIYPHSRYLTVTGHPIKSGALVNCPRIYDIAAQISENRNQRIAFVSSGSSVSSVTSVSSVDFVTLTSLGYEIKIPRSLIPDEEGCRNQTIFQLARHLKGLEPNKTQSYFKPVLREWFEHALPHIRTKSFETSWMDFYVSFENVKFPKGLIFESITSNLPELSDKTLGWNEFGELGNRLLQLCHGLHEYWGDTPFFLSVREAGKFLNVDHTVAAKLLRAFQLAGIVTVTQKSTTYKATRFKLNLAGQ